MSIPQNPTWQCAELNPEEDGVLELNCSNVQSLEALECITNETPQVRTMNSKVSM